MKTVQCSLYSAGSSAATPSSSPWFSELAPAPRGSRAATGCPGLRAEHCAAHLHLRQDLTARPGQHQEQRRLEVGLKRTALPDRTPGQRYRKVLLQDTGGTSPAWRVLLARHNVVGAVI